LWWKNRQEEKKIAKLRPSIASQAMVMGVIPDIMTKLSPRKAVALGADLKKVEPADSGSEDEGPVNEDGEVIMDWDKIMAKKKDIDLRMPILSAHEIDMYLRSVTLLIRRIYKGESIVHNAKVVEMEQPKKLKLVKKSEKYSRIEFKKSQDKNISIGEIKIKAGGALDDSTLNQSN
jgi:hypothetical protein